MGQGAARSASWRYSTFAPLYGVWVFLTGTRESIGRRMSTEEVESNKDVDFLESMPQIQEALVASRDAKLVEDLSSAVEKNGANKRIAVIYGARHMRVVSRLLTGKYHFASSNRSGSRCSATVDLGTLRSIASFIQCRMKEVCDGSNQ